MKKTLYEILEVSQTASKEIIEKAYKVLAKKYHPDLQPPEGKEKAEQKMKEINEAYSVLSDEVKRKEYDIKLEQETIQQTKMEQNSQNQENYYQASQTQTSENRGQQEYSQNASEKTKRPMTEEEYKEAKKREQEYIKNQQKMQQEIQRNMQAQYEAKYQQAYEDYLRSLGYKIKYKWTWKNYKDLFITIGIILFIIAVLWIFPPTHNWMMDFYHSNAIIRTIIDIIGSIFVGIWNAICSIFK